MTRQDVWMKLASVGRQDAHALLGSWFGWLTATTATLQADVLRTFHKGRVRLSCRGHPGK
jgi:hypothetical protein